jgi:hypothetical protein
MLEQEETAITKVKVTHSHMCVSWPVSVARRITLATAEVHHRLPAEALQRLLWGYYMLGTTAAMQVYTTYTVTYWHTHERARDGSMCLAHNLAQTSSSTEGTVFTAIT